MLINPNRINTLVFFIDSYIDKEDKRNLFIKRVRDLHWRYNFCLITKNRNNYSSIASICALHDWQLQLPNILFQKEIMNKYSIGMDSIAYISDDLIDFLQNVRGAFCFSIFLSNNTYIPYENAGYVPDLVYSELDGFFKDLEDGNLYFKGEGMLIHPNHINYHFRPLYSRYKIIELFAKLQMQLQRMHKYPKNNIGLGLVTAISLVFERVIIGVLTFQENKSF